MLTRERLAAKGGPRYLEIEVPEFEDTIRLRSFNADDWLQLIGRPAGADSSSQFEFAVRMIASVAVDAEGAALFEDEAAATRFFTDWPLVAQRLVVEILKVNGLPVEAAKKN